MLTTIIRWFIGGEQEREIRRLHHEVAALERLRAQLNDSLSDLQAELDFALEREEQAGAASCAAALGLAAGLDAHRRLDRVRGQARRWGWSEEAIASLLALPGERRTHVFPAPEGSC
jgi:hypothetical protein